MPGLKKSRRMIQAHCDMPEASTQSRSAVTEATGDCRTCQVLPPVGSNQDRSNGILIERGIFQSTTTAVIQMNVFVEQRLMPSGAPQSQKTFLSSRLVHNY